MTRIYRMCFKIQFRRWIPYQPKISWAISTTNRPTRKKVRRKKVRRQGTHRKCIHQFKSKQDNGQNSTPNLRNLIAATDLVILPKSDPNRRFFGPWDLKLWRMTLKNNREPLPCLYKLCVSFHNHPWIRIRVTRRKQSYQSKLSIFFLSVYSMLYVILCYNGPCYKRVPTVHISALVVNGSKGYPCKRIGYIMLLAQRKISNWITSEKQQVSK